MKPKWIIEDFDEINSYAILAEEVKRQGYEVEIIRYLPFESGSYNKFGDDECVIVQSSLQIARQLLREKKWVPNAWLSLQNYECSTYYAYLGKYLFNDRYTMMPVCEVKRNIDFLFEQFGKQDCLFIRPSSGFKTFSGQVFTKENFAKDWIWVEQFSAPTHLAVVSSPKTIKAEYRFIVTKDGIVTGCQYKKDGNLNLDKDYPESAGILAEEVCKVWQPDSIFALDICTGNDGNYYLLEIGSFSCAGLYVCDMSKIVEVASRIAVKEYQELNS